MCELKVEIHDEEIDYCSRVPFFSIEEFLKEYEKYPCLWDKKHELFRNKRQRVRCENKLCEFFNLPDVVYLRKKIRSIRGTYNTEIRKIKQSIEGNTEVYPPKLSWFSVADKFLRVTTDLPYRVFPLIEEDPTSLDNSFRKQKGVSLFFLNENMSKRQKLNSEGNSLFSEGQLEKSIENDESTEQYEEYEELESFQDPSTDEFKFDGCDVNEELDFDQTEHLEIASSVPEVTNSASSSDLRIIAKCLKTLTKSSENEFAAFGQWLALQLQSMPLPLALQMQMDIQAHISKSRVDYMKNGKV